MPLSRTQLIPIQEMSPGGVGAIRNAVIDAIVAQASQELSMPADRLVVRDIRPFNDLQMYSAGTTDATVNSWTYDASTTTAAAFTSVTGAKTMGDQRYVAIYGVRDLRSAAGVHTTGMVSAVSAAVFGVPGAFRKNIPAVVAMIKINVGGADKVFWDISSIYAYEETLVGFSPSAVIIPQNASFNISYAFRTTVAGIRTSLQLIGVCVEPRGKVISP
jgi:hypothetical protein